MHPLILFKRQADAINSRIPRPFGQVVVPPYIEAAQRQCEAISKRVGAQFAALRSPGTTRAEWGELTGTAAPPAPAPLPAAEPPEPISHAAVHAEPLVRSAPEPPPKLDTNAVGFHAHDVQLWLWKFRQEEVADNPAAAHRKFWSSAKELEPLAGHRGKDKNSVVKRLRSCARAKTGA